MSAFFDPLPRAMSATEFVQRFGGIYEHSPWVAQAIADTGIDSSHDHSAGLALAMRKVVNDAGFDRQLELLRAHPDLAGRAAVRGELSQDSTAEQASAGLDQCTAEEFAELQDLNTRYKDKFGFPYILAVRGKSRGDILADFRRRIDNDADTEFATALEQVHRIARLRLEALSAAPSAAAGTHQQNPFRHWVNLARPRLGTRVVEVSDEFFGACERMLQDDEPVFIADRYDDHGKWMDGWESRRRRGGGHDYCVIRLGQPGVLHGVDIDTRYFTGNYPPAADLQGCWSDSEVPPADAEWFPLLPRLGLEANRHHYHAVNVSRAVTHVRLNIYPDGGVARLRLYGEVQPDWASPDSCRAIDLLAVEAGGRALCCSDEHYGSMHNLNCPGRGVNMGDGWETARRRGAGHDWVILLLGTPGVIDQVEIDTAHFKGNYPERAVLEGLNAARDADPADLASASEWQVLLPEARLQADTVHCFDIDSSAAVSHVRLSIYPDGGVSRLRLRGRPLTVAS